MDNDLIKELIEVSDITEKRFENGKQAKIKGNGKTYTVYEKKQDGTTSAAWSALERVGIGSTIQVCYVEKPGEFEGKAYTSRIVRIINEDIGNGMANSLSQQQTHRPTGSPTAAQSKDDKFWEQQAYEKCQSLWSAAAIQNGTSTSDIINIIGQGNFWQLFQAIKADGKKRFFDFGKPQGVQGAYLEPLPEDLPIVDAETPAKSELDSNAPGACFICGAPNRSPNDELHDCIPFN